MPRPTSWQAIFWRESLTIQPPTLARQVSYLHGSAAEDALSERTQTGYDTNGVLTGWGLRRQLGHFEAPYGTPSLRRAIRVIDIL
jgi:hypothetical protein